MTFVVGIVVGGIGDHVLNAQQIPIKRTDLLTADLAGMVGKELVVRLVEFAPGGASGKHWHPGHEANYLLEGSVIAEMEGHPPMTRQAGEVAYTPAQVVHEAKNASTTAPAKLVVFRIHAARRSGGISAEYHPRREWARWRHGDWPAAQEGHDAWGRVLAALGVLGASLAAHAQSPANAFRAETILTEWGTFRCSAIDCAQVPRASLDVYWMAPTLVITRNQTPLVMRTCERLPEHPMTWDCRIRRRAPRQPAGDLDALWSWVLAPPFGEEWEGF